jgi:GMP synthase (glutamine-hydrolysing)
MSHGDLVTKAPEGFKVTAKSKNCPISAIANDEKKFYGIQFHAEVRNSEYGLDILRTLHSMFAMQKLTGRWMISLTCKLMKFVKKSVIRKLSWVFQVVLIQALQLFLHKAIGDQLTAIFVDHGMLRKDEGDQVMQALNKDLGVNIIRVNAQERFLNKLEGRY